MKHHILIRLLPMLLPNNKFLIDIVLTCYRYPEGELQKYVFSREHVKWKIDLIEKL